MATSNPLTKVARPHETTCTQLHKIIADVPFHFDEIFSGEIATFLQHKSVSLNSSIGYFTHALLTTTAFLSAKNGCTVETIMHEQPMNIYTIFVGYPGKSSAIQQRGCREPIWPSSSEMIIHEFSLTERHLLVSSNILQQEIVHF